MQTTTSKISTAASATKASSPSVFRRIISKIAWLYDRFVFYVIYRGERLRPEIIAQMEKEDEDERNGKSTTSPKFTDLEESFKWLDSDEE